MNRGNADHFDKISNRYDQAAKSWRMIYDQAKKYINPLVRAKTVLDIGTGGNFAYDTNLPSQIIAMDISPAMLDKIKNANVIKIVSDARHMKCIKDESVDVIIFMFALHHINGSSVKDSLETLDKILFLAERKIRPGGYLILAEDFLPLIFYALQCLFFRFTQFILTQCAVPMIFFFSLETFMQKLSKYFHLTRSEIKLFPLPLRGWIDPLTGSFPGRIKIPANLHPLRFHLIIVAKKGSDEAP